MSCHTKTLLTKIEAGVLQADSSENEMAKLKMSDFPR